jgi:RNA polymerase sigma-70 factor (ECF subfamily)
MTSDPRKEIVEHLGSLRAFAMSLARNSATADDLVQETIVKAWANIDKFEAGTNMRAWLFTILRNQFYSELRRKWREVEDADGKLTATLAVRPEQLGHMDMKNFLSALQELPDDQREALVLVGASGFAYEEAAEITGVAVGTVKSRVSRARARLAEILQLTDKLDFGGDANSDAVLSNLMGN